MGTTSIEWTRGDDGMKGRVWNPVTGCKPGKQCWHRCYARRMASRLRGRAGYPKDEPFRVTLHPDRLDEPLHWRKPCRVFVCSMGEWMFAPWPFLDRMMLRMKARHQWTFLTLTKEPGLLLKYLTEGWRKPVPPNVWLGASVEDQPAANERLRHLLRCKRMASLLFVSHEPCLGPINYRGLLGAHGIQWLISGPETGPGARPCESAWLRNDQTQASVAGIPWFLKRLPWTADPSEFPTDLQGCREVQKP